MRVLVRQDHEFQLHRAQALSFPQTAGFGMEGGVGFLITYLR